MRVMGDLIRGLDFKKDSVGGAVFPESEVVVLRVGIFCVHSFSPESVDSTY